MLPPQLQRAYRQLPLDPRDWPHGLFFSEGGRYYVDVSLPFGMGWVAASCQNVTSLIARHLSSQGAHILTYSDNFCRVDSNKEQAQSRFHHRQAILDDLGLMEAKHKAFPPSQNIT